MCCMFSCARNAIIKTQYYQRKNTITAFLTASSPMPRMILQMWTVEKCRRRKERLMAKRKRHRITHTHSWSRLPEQEQGHKQQEKSFLFISPSSKSCLYCWVLCICYQEEEAEDESANAKKLRVWCVVLINWVRSLQLLGEQITH